MRKIARRLWATASSYQDGEVLADDLTRLAPRNGADLRVRNGIDIGQGSQEHPMDEGSIPSGSTQ